MTMFSNSSKLTLICICSCFHASLKSLLSTMAAWRAHTWDGGRGNGMATSSLTWLMWANGAERSGHRGWGMRLGGRRQQKTSLWFRWKECTQQFPRVSTLILFVFCLPFVRSSLMKGVIVVYVSDSLIQIWLSGLRVSIVKADRPSFEVIISNLHELSRFSSNNL